MNEHMDDYLVAQYIILEKNYWTWDPLLFHWGIFYIIINACVYGLNDDLLTCMYTPFHDSLCYKEKLTMAWGVPQ